MWHIVSDIALPTWFSTEVTSVNWLNDERGLGARFTGHSAHPVIGEWNTTCEITELEDQRRLAWIVLGQGERPSSTWRFTIEPRTETTVELTQWIQMGPERGGLNFAIDRMPEKEDRIITRRLEEHRQNMELNLAGVKAIAETPPTTEPATPNA